MLSLSDHAVVDHFDISATRAAIRTSQALVPEPKVPGSWLANSRVRRQGAQPLPRHNPRRVAIDAIVVMSASSS